MTAISPYSSKSANAYDGTNLSGGEGRLCAASAWLDGGTELVFLENARSALWTCLKFLELKQTDEVCIETTSGGPYISSCVTRTIESVCNWSRSVNSKTKLIIVIHEFGFPCNELKLKRLARAN